MSICDLVGGLAMGRSPVQRVIRIPSFRINSESEQARRRKAKKIIQ
jgi:hypothetical protein